MTELTVNKIKYQVKVELDTLYYGSLEIHLISLEQNTVAVSSNAALVRYLSKGRTVRSCGVKIEEVLDEEITTIEGLSNNNSHPVQQAWIAEEVPQCGYCQSGQILTAVSLLNRKSNPTDADIDRGMLNLCRCGTYTRVRKSNSCGGRNDEGDIMSKFNRRTFLKLSGLAGSGLLVGCNIFLPKDTQQPSSFGQRP